MRRMNLSVLSAVGLAVVFAAAGCGGGSSSVSGPDAVPVAAGSAVIQGTVVGSGFATSPHGDVVASSGDSGMTVRVEGTGLSTAVDEEGEFILASVPAGSITLIFEGAGTNAKLIVSGVLDGQVMSLEVQVSGGDAHVTTPAYCTPTKYTKITGPLEEMTGSQLRVSGTPVDASQISKVWRGDRRIDLEQLVVGEKVKVWGTLNGNGVLLAEEIKALTSGQKTWVTLEGRVSQVASSALDVHANPNGGSGSCASASAGDMHANPYGSTCPTFYVEGQKVVTDSGTKFTKAGGGAFDPASIAVGQHAYVEGWRKSSGPVTAEKVVIG